MHRRPFDDDKYQLDNPRKTGQTDSKITSDPGEGHGGGDTACYPVEW